MQRPGAMEMLTGCISKGIPVAIVSAGLSFVIEEFVRKHDASGKFFSKVLYIVTLYSKCSRLTFENSCQAAFSPPRSFPSTQTC